MTKNIIGYGYMMNVVDDNVVKHEIEYNIKEASVKHYAISFTEAITYSPTDYTAPDGTIYTWDNELITLTEEQTEI